MAFKELAKHLSHENLFQSSGNVIKLIIELISNGGSIDDYKAGMRVLSKNKWYQSAWKNAHPLSLDANLNVLKKFAGNNGTVTSPYQETSNLLESIVTTAKLFTV